jgi:hypothetical protein
VRPIRRGEIGSDGVGAAAGLADFRDDGFCLFRAAAVMDKYRGIKTGCVPLKQCVRKIS